MSWNVLINATDVATLGFYVEQVAGWLHAPERSFPTTKLPGRLGTVLSADPEIGPRTLRLVGSIRTSANTIAARMTAEKQLKALAYRGLVVLTMDDSVNPPLSIDAVCQGVAVEPKSHPMTTPVSSVDARFLCPDPAYYETAGSILAFGTTLTPVPLGNSTSGGIIKVVATTATNATNPTITYATPAGTTIQTLGFTGITLVKDEDFLSIDLDRATVTLSDNGVVANAIANLASGEFFAPDASDGDFAQSSWPRLKVATAAGVPSATLSYTKRWL